MKKGLALCMAAVLAMGCLLTGCGSSDTGAKSTTESAAASTETVGTEKEAASNVYHFGMRVSIALLLFKIGKRE